MQKADFETLLEGLEKEEAETPLNYDDIWKITKEHLKLTITNRVFQSLFANSYIEDISNGVVQISCDSDYKMEKILRDYKAILRQAITKATGKILEIEINVNQTIDTPIKTKYEYHDPLNNQTMDLFSEAEKEKKQLETRLEESHLNQKYLFSNFVVGPNNRLAEAVAQAVVENLGKVYNPLFFYGNTGLGKTHLMQAIGNELLRKDPTKKVIYISIEQFLNEMVESIRTKRNEDFRNKYRAVDLLIIDDLQFVETYPRTQEELFHTFNALYQANKQIILASDRPPKEIKNLTDRLRTRFEGGMVADIQPPDYETRLAIIKQIMEEKGKDIEIPDEYIDLIAKNIQSSVRELEGAVVKVCTLFKLGNIPSYEDVSRILQIDIDYKRKTITTAKVIAAVSEVFDIKISEIKGKRRTSYASKCRQVVMYILRKELELPLEKIAKEVNRKDHTTVINACDRVVKLMGTEPKFNERVEECLRLLRS